MSGFDFGDMFAAQRATVAALVAVGNTALMSAERMAALNLHAVREAMVDFAQGTQRMLNVQSPREAGAPPRVLLCNTVKGKGVSFMEDQLAWHYKSPNEEQLRQAPPLDLNLKPWQTSRQSA